MTKEKLKQDDKKVQRKQKSFPQHWEQQDVFSWSAHSRSQVLKNM